MRCQFHPGILYCPKCLGTEAPHETLAEWAKRAGVHVETPRKFFNCRVVADSFKWPRDRVLMFSLSDYYVSSISAGTVWFSPINVVTEIPSEPKRAP